MNETHAVVLKRPGDLRVERIAVPSIPGPSVRVEMRACGICGSDVRYLQGENPWALHTLGVDVPSPPNMVLGHEVSGIVRGAGGDRRVAILAYKACGQCAYCRSGRENLCDDTQHFGHGAGWDAMAYYPGGMSERFDIWQGSAHDIPDAISFESATFLDGLAVAIHAVNQAGVRRGCRAAFVGLGPIGLLAAQVARAKGAGSCRGCDAERLPVGLAREVGLDGMIHGTSADLASPAGAAGGFDVVVDTVGSAESIQDGLSMLDKSGALALLAVHQEAAPIRPIALSGERRLVTSANNSYAEFAEAIDLLASGAVRVEPLVTHRFALAHAREAFDAMLHKADRGAYKVMLHP